MTTKRKTKRFYQVAEVPEGEDDPCTSEFWYDLFDGGGLEPEKLLVKPEEVAEVQNAMKVLEKYKKSLENKFEYLYI